MFYNPYLSYFLFPFGKQLRGSVDQLGALQTFGRVVELGGFAAAARELGVARSTVQKTVVGLEQSLGTQLLRRSTRSVTPTEAGRLLHERCAGPVAELRATLGSLAALRETPAGRLRVNAPLSFGTLRLSRAVADFAVRYPEVRVELVLNDRFVDPIEEGFDVTLRIAEPRHLTSLSMRPLAAFDRLLCAAPAYLARRGEPATPADLARHDCLHYGYLESGNVWRLRDGDRERAARVNCVFYSNNGEVLRDAASAGRGIALLPTFIAEPALADGHLRRVLVAHEPAPLSLHALYARHRYLSAAVRAFVDYLADALGRRLARPRRS